MNEQEAIDIANAFIATRPKSWRQVWPAKRLGVKFIRSEKSDAPVCSVRSLPQGLGMRFIVVEISLQTRTVIYAYPAGGRAFPEEFLPPQTS